MTAGTSLFVFAHQDDEFGVYATIAAAVRAGERVLCVYVTDGALGGAPARRDRESLDVLARLGVPAANVQFLGVVHGIGDGRLHERLPIVGAQLVRVLEALPPDARVFVPAWEGGHHDHDALHAVVVTLLAARGRLAHARQFSLYNAAGCPGPFFRVLAPLPANGPVERTRLPLGERLRQLRHCLRYPSQRTTWLGLYPFVLWHMLWRGCQSLQPVEPARLAERPHAGRLYYEKRGFLGHDVLQRSLAAWRATLASPARGTATPAAGGGAGG